MSRHTSHPLIILLVAGALIRLFFVFAVPLYPAQTALPGYNDEPLHLEYIRYIVKWDRLPVWRAEVSDANPLTGEYVQPPFYYLLCNTAFRFGEMLREGAGLYGARLLSLLLGLVAGLFVYWSARRITGSEPAALAAFIPIMFSPNTVFFSALVTNDAALACVCSMAFHSLLLNREGYGGSMRQVKTGVYLGLGVWVKYSAFVLFPLGFLAAPFSRRNDEEWSSRLGERWMASWRVLITAAAIAAPLIIWRVLLYGFTYRDVGRYTPQAALGVSGGGLSHPLMALKLFLRYAAAPFEQTWGSGLEKVISLLFVVILCVAFVRGAREVWRISERWVVFGALILMGAAFLAYNSRNFQVEFRLLAPILTPLAIVTGWGFERLGLPLWAQSIIWAAPTLIIPLLRP